MAAHPLFGEFVNVGAIDKAECLPHLDVKAVDSQDLSISRSSLLAKMGGRCLRRGAPWFEM